MKPICIIPARGGSKGVPKKNIRKINGKPLIGHVIESNLQSKVFSHVIVSTEDKKIASIAKKYGAEVPFMRPNNLARGTTPMDDVLLHAVKKLYELDYKFDIFILRDATTPFVRISDVLKSIRLLKKIKCFAVCGVYRQHLNPYFNMVETNSRGFLRLSKILKKRPKSRQEAPIVYQLNGLYTYDAKKFLKHKFTDFGKCRYIEIPSATGFMIDTEFEFKIAKLLIENKILRN